MRVFADNFQLADNGQIEPGLEFNGERQLQVDDGPRWTEVQVRDRFNERNDISFTVNRLHASIIAAERYCIEHPKKVPRLAKVLLMVCDYGGPRVELKLINAGITTVRSTYFGCTSRHTYQIVGGRIQS